MGVGAYLIEAIGSSAAPAMSASSLQNVHRGVNLESGTWGWWPTPSYYDYYLDRNFKFFRLCFNWLPLQPNPEGDLSAPLLAHMDAVIARLTSRNAVVILDQHDYMRRVDKIIGQSEISARLYAGLWARLARYYRDNPLVWFGLMNEPHDVDLTILANTLNAAILAIRQSGARNTILCPGTDWSNGERWLQSGNDKLANMIRQDEALIFEVHQYLDAWGRGQDPTAEVGAGGRLDIVTAWAKRTGRQLFLGEFSSGFDVAALHELSRLLKTIAANPEVWVGYCYWSSGGGKTSDRWYSLDPVNGKDRPQIEFLT